MGIDEDNKKASINTEGGQEVEMSSQRSVSTDSAGLKLEMHSKGKEDISGSVLMAGFAGRNFSGPRINRLANIKVLKNTKACNKFQPLHHRMHSGSNQVLTDLAIQSNRSFQKSMFKKQFPSQKLKEQFSSPTDSLLSPCSQKLNSHKSKLFKIKQNPTKLNFAIGKTGHDDLDD